MLEQMDGLVGELLAMAQRIVPKPVRVDLATFVAAQEARHQDTVAAKDLTITVKAEGSGTFDPAVIGRIQTNLLRTVIRHAPERGILGTQRGPNRNGRQW